MLNDAMIRRLLRGAVRGSILGVAGFALMTGVAHARNSGEPWVGLQPPANQDAVILFSGKREQIAQNWVMLGSNQPGRWDFDHGAMVSRYGDIISKTRFQNYRLHVEFKVPYMPNAHGQARGNSGVYQQGRYEIQVLDSYGIKDPGTGDCGAVYSQSAPLVNACKPPLVWQSYDIVFRAPRFDENHQQTEPAHVTIFQNGILIQNNTPIKGPTGGAMDDNVDQPGPVRLQYHGDRMMFRNIWVVPLPEHGALHY